MCCSSPRPPASPDGFTIADEPTPGGRPRTTTDPRTAFVEVSDVAILSYRALSDVGWAQPLITTEDGAPLIVAGERDGQQAAVFAFALSDSDLPLTIAFPILMTNLIDSFKPASMAGDGGGQAERPHPLRPPLAADALRVTLPDGSLRELPVIGREMTFAETDQLGVYTIEAIRAGQPTQTESFAVNLFSPPESDITPRTASLGGQALQTNTADERQPLELWPWVALLALAVLVLEWVYYHRRQRLPTPPAKPTKPARQKTWVSR
jgi:Ca-activated chloride channel homolog